MHHSVVYTSMRIINLLFLLGVLTFVPAGSQTAPGMPCSSGTSALTASQMDALGNYDPVPGCSTYCTSMTRPVCDANRTLQITTLKPCQTKLKNVCGKGNATLSFFLNGNLYKCQGNSIDKNAKTNLTDEICDYDMESDLMHDIEVQLEYGVLSAFAVVTIGLTIILIFLRLLPQRRKS